MPSTGERIFPGGRSKLNGITHHPTNRTIENEENSAFEPDPIETARLSQ